MAEKPCKAVVRHGLRLVVLSLLAAGLVAGAHAQGIHTTLRSQVNPYPAYQSYAGVWGDGHYAYLASEARDGVLIYDISNPDAPVLASYYAPADSHAMEDIKVANGVGYFASNQGFGLHIVDVSDPTNPVLLSKITAANGGFDNTHKIAVWQNFLFIPQNQLAPAIIKVFDVSNPAAPVLKTTFTATDPQWVNDITIQDNGAGSVRLYAAGWNSKCDIWDITNIATQAPVLLGSFTAGLFGSSSSATADGNYLAYSRKTIDGTSEVKIYNISNPASVTVASTLTMTALGIDAVAPHDPHIVGNLMYVSWYQAGTLIFDITDRANPVLIGSYDTWPGTVASGQLDGNWGVYPYLGQDRVLLSDRNTGLYIVDATAVSSQAALYNFKLNPTSVVGPASSIGTVYMVGIAPSGGAVANLTSNNSLVVVPPSVTVPQGAANAAFTATTTAVSSKTTATLTASYGGASKSSVLTLTPEIPSKLTFNPTSVLGGVSSTGTVTMAGPAPVDTVVTLAVTSGGSAVASLPSSVTVPMGSSSATFGVVTKSVSATTTVKISASSNGTTVTGTLTVTPNTPKSLTFSPGSVIGGASSTGTVTLKSAAASDTTVTLTVTSGGSAVGSIPGSVTVPMGSSTATFVVVTNLVSATTTVKVSASASGSSVTGTLTVTGNTPKSLAFSPGSVIGGASSTGTVTLSVAATSDTSVALAVTSGGSGVGSIPSSVTVLAGATTATFTVVTNPVVVKTTVQVSATLNGSSKTGTLTVTANTPTSVSFTPGSVIGGANSTGKVVFGRVLASDTVVTLSIVTGGSAVASMPSSVTVLAGNTSGTWTVVTNAVTSTTSVQISATANGGSKTGTLTVTPNTPTSVTFTPGSVTGGANSTGKVFFGRAQATDTVVTLSIVSGGSAVASMPASITVPAGSSSGTWTLVTSAVNATTTVQVSATAFGGSKTGSLTVKPNTPTAFTFTPGTVTGGGSSVGKVTFGLALASDTTVTITVNSGSEAIASVPANFTVLAGSTSGTFTVITAPVTQTTAAQFTVAANTGTKTATLTVQ